MFRFSHTSTFELIPQSPRFYQEPGNSGGALATVQFEQNSTFCPPDTSPRIVSTSGTLRLLCISPLDVFIHRLGRFATRWYMKVRSTTVTWCKLQMRSSVHYHFPAVTTIQKSKWKIGIFAIWFLLLLSERIFVSNDLCSSQRITHFKDTVRSFLLDTQLIISKQQVEFK